MRIDYDGGGRLDDASKLTGSIDVEKGRNGIVTKHVSRRISIRSTDYFRVYQRVADVADPCTCADVKRLTSESSPRDHESFLSRVDMTPGMVFWLGNILSATGAAGSSYANESVCLCSRYRKYGQALFTNQSQAIGRF